MLYSILKTLFKEKIEAWEYGPVVPTVYHEYKKYSNKPIVLENDISTVDIADKKNLDKVWENFGGYSARRLVDMTHAHKPWKEASGEITIKSLADYYAPLLNK